LIDYKATSPTFIQSLRPDYFSGHQRDLLRRRLCWPVPSTRPWDPSSSSKDTTRACISSHFWTTTFHHNFSTSCRCFVGHPLCSTTARKT